MGNRFRGPVAYDTKYHLQRHGAAAPDMSSSSRDPGCTGFENRESRFRELDYHDAQCFDTAERIVLRMPSP